MLTSVNMQLIGEGKPLGFVSDIEIKVNTETLWVEATTIRSINDKRVYEDWVVTGIFDEGKLIELEPRHHFKELVNAK